MVRHDEIQPYDSQKIHDIKDNQPCPHKDKGFHPFIKSKNKRNKQKKTSQKV